jgi:hypothetical protein
VKSKGEITFPSSVEDFPHPSRSPAGTNPKIYSTSRFDNRRFGVIPESILATPAFAGTFPKRVNAGCPMSRF